MPQVLIAPATLTTVDGPYRSLLREAGFELVFPRKAVQLTEDELLRDFSGIAASLAGSEPYTRRVIEALPQLRVIARAGVGYDAVDLAAATDRGVAVTITPGTNQDSVAEHTFAMMLALAKDLVPQHLATKAGQWPRQSNQPLRGRTLGIAGLGRIGKAVAVRGAVFGMNLLAYEPYPDAPFVAQYGVKLVPFEKLLAESDYVTLHVPLTPESKHLMNRRTLALMKPTAFLINTARGGLVSEADLFEVLRAGKIAGAALDVFEEEPPGKIPLFTLDNVLVTPHTAGVDVQSRDDMAFAAARAIVNLSRGDWPAEQVVNPAVRASFAGEPQLARKEAHMAAADSTESSGAPTPHDLKLALKAFRKRLRLTQLDEESKISGGPMSGGRRAEIVAITPPQQYPQAVWDELVKQGKLKYVGHAMYELVDA